MSKRILMVEHQKDDRQIGLRTPGKLIFPEVFESVRRQCRVADRGHDRSVAKIGLDGASVVAVVGELKPAGMPQHVGMHEEREFRSYARPGNHALISGCGQRRVALRDEDVWGRCGFAQELAQRAAFPRRYWMHAGIPALGPAYMQAPSSEVDVVPAQCHQLGGPETAAVSNQDSRGVPMSFCLAASMSRSTSRSVRYS